jgi:HSP20 family molecular chaperone IbpA
MKLTRSQRQNLRQWSPFDQLTRLRDEINRFFESPLPMRSGWGTTSPMFEGWSPSVDLFEDKDGVTVKAEVPGMKKEDIEVSLEGRTLSQFAVSGGKRKPKARRQPIVQNVITTVMPTKCQYSATFVISMSCLAVIFPTKRRAKQ